MDDAGNARIVWVERAAGSTDPFLPVTRITGVVSTCGAFTLLSTSQSLFATVAMGPVGDAMVGWADPSGRVRVLHGGGGGGIVPDHTLSPTAGLPVLALDAHGNGIAVWRQGTVSKGAGFDAVAPIIRRISIPSVIERGVRVHASASAFDVWGATIRWKFGDGGTVRGRSVHHTFQHSGNYRVRVIATDRNGVSRSAARRVKVKDHRRRQVER